MNPKDNTKKIVAVDTGYGRTKIATGPDDFQVFSSYLVRGTESGLTNTHKIVVDNKSYYVGDGAANQEDLISLIGTDFHGSVEWKALLGYALSLTYAQLGEELDTLVLGLPLSQFNDKNTSKLVSLKEGQGFTFSIGSKETADEYRYKIKNMIILPQGAGAIFPYLNNDEVIGIVDIGFYTLDLAYFAHGDFNPAYSSSSAFGISELYKRIINFIQSKFDVEINTDRAEKVLKANKIKISGVWYEIPDEIKKIKREFAEDLMLKVKSKWDNQLKLADKIVFVGGGAEALKGYFPESANFIIPEQPAFANVKGFYQYALDSNG